MLVSLISFFLSSFPSKLFAVLTLFSSLIFRFPRRYSPLA